MHMHTRMHILMHVFVYTFPIVLVMSYMGSELDPRASTTIALSNHPRSAAGYSYGAGFGAAWNVVVSVPGGHVMYAMFTSKMGKKW